MTPTEKDAMALSGLAHVAENMVPLATKVDVQVRLERAERFASNIRTHGAHLASRIAELEAERDKLLRPNWMEQEGLARQLLSEAENIEAGNETSRRPSNFARMLVELLRSAGRVIISLNARATRAEAELAAVRVNAITPQHGELGAAIDRAAGKLPEGWEIRVCVERGAGWAELYSPGYEQVELPDMDGTLADHIDAAIDAARGGE